MGDASARDVLLRALKEQGIAPEPTAVATVDAEAYPLPRIHRSKPRPGRTHPASVADIEMLLRWLGEPCTYGLRAVELSLAVAADGRRPRIARLVGHGLIRVYDQPPSPWLLPGRPCAADADRLFRAGAVVQSVAGGSQTRVRWPENTLRDFMLFDGLAHEIGHHMLQQYTGKRTARVARTRDHEAFADRFAARCRASWNRATPREP